MNDDVAQAVFAGGEKLRAFFFAMLESLPGGLLLADRQGNMLAANARAAAILGLAGSSLQSRTCWELLRHLAGPGQDFTPLSVSGGRLLCEIPASGDGAEERCVLICRNDLTSPFLEVAGFFLSLEDVTMSALLSLHAERSQRLVAMREMAEAMSQELKNPLGSLELYVSMLKRELAADPENERIAARMQGAVRTMHHLLDNFVTFAGFAPPRMERLTLDEAMKSGLQTLREIAGERGVELETVIEAGESVLAGDRAMLRQLLLNLGLNAIESMPAGGVVSFFAGKRRPARGQAPVVELLFRDQGEGIAREDLQRIFDPFFSTRGGNRGLGLANCHAIVEAHGGLIKVESEPGRGSTLRVLLPLASGLVPEEGNRERGARADV